MTMLQSIFRIAFLPALFLLMAVPNAMALDVGKPAPDFKIVTIDGKVFKPSDAKGKVIVLNLWATWCTYCRQEMPALETYYEKHKDQGLRMVAVSMDDASEEGKVDEIAKAYSYTIGVGHLSDLDGFGRIWRIPMTFVIDRNGILRRDGSEGDPKVDLASLERDVTPLLKAGKIQPEEQKAH